MHKIESINKRTSWLTDENATAESLIFSLPKAIQFLISMDAEARQFYPLNINNRIAAYLWWTKVKERNPGIYSIDWMLDQQERDFLLQIPLEKWLTEYKYILHQYLQVANKFLPEVDNGLGKYFKTIPTNFDESEFTLEIPGEIFFLLECREDLSQVFNLNKLSGLHAFMEWWKKEGEKLYVKLNVDLDVLVDILHKESLLYGYKVPIFISLLLIERKDIFGTYDLKTVSGVQGFINWWNEYGKLDYPLLTWDPSAVILYHNEPIKLISGIQLPRFIPLLISERSDLKNNFDINTISGINGFIDWWCEFGQSIYPFLQWDPLNVISFMLECSPLANKVQIPRFVQLLVNERKDLNAHFKLNSIGGINGFISWWSEVGRFAFANFEWDPSSLIAHLEEMFIKFGKIKLPLFITLLLEDRKDLCEVFDLNTVIGLNGFIRWWKNHGSTDYSNLQWDINTTIDNLQILVPTSAGVKIPLFLLELQQQIPELKNSINVSDITDILSLVNWWQQQGYKELDCFEVCLDLDEMGFLINVSKEGNSIPLFLDAIFEKRIDLQSVFKNNGLVNCNELISWWNTYGCHEYPVLQSVSLEVTVGSDIKCIFKTTSNKPLGINIVGFPQGTLGLGEDARLAGQVIESLGLDGVYINAPIPGPAKTVMPEGKLPIVKNCRFSTTLFCLPPTEMIRLAIEGGQHLIDNDEYKIGAWPWELPHWPASLARVRDFVDEIWAQSEYVKDCFLKEGHTPVHKMPMAVTIPQPDADLREQLGITDNSFVYYLMFDGNSWLSRKNPIAGVLAFQQAFAASSEYQNVRLLIKAMNINANDPMWQKIVHMANQDSRIIIITERMDRQTLINMMNACDCYISLHRSEGFGRVIAEAMLLGQPVVATNFSGNVDFCKKDTAFLVDGDLLPLQQGDYIFFEGQYWCDPDIDTAAMQLLKIYEDKSLRQEVALSGQSLIQRNYSVSAVAAFYSERFQEISKYNGYKP